MLPFLFLVLGTVAGCKSALDCNAAQCYDCACVDQVCKCGDGWSGDSCQTPFCQTRSDCNNHGACSITLHNISCICDPGYVGDRCQTQSCPLVCQHGGSPDANCTQCTGCLGAWGGKQCDQWNSSVPLDTLLSQLETIFSGAQAMLNAEAPLNPLCRQSQECAGWGVNVAYGSVSSFPIVQLSYNNSNRTWQGFREPAEATVTPFQSPLPNYAVGSAVYSTISDFTNFVGGLLGQGSGLSGIYSQSWDSVFQQFQDPQDVALTVINGEVALYKMSLPFDLQKQMYVFTWDKFALRALQSLPPDYSSPTNQAVYNKFFSTYGTSVVVTSLSGGLMQQTSAWRSFLDQTGYTPQSLLWQGELEYTASTGLGGWFGSPDPTYQQNRVRNSVLCLGGDPTTCKNSSAWMASLSVNPILTSYSVAPISEFIEDASLRGIIEGAVASFLAAERDAWNAKNKCPTSCSGYGVCTPPSLVCSCWPTSFKGRMCSASFAYQCPEQRVTGSGAWASYGCLGQLATTPNCVNVLGGGSPTTFPCPAVNAPHQLYSCPFDLTTGSGDWASYGCLGQVGFSPTCTNVWSSHGGHLYTKDCSAVTPQFYSTPLYKCPEARVTGPGKWASYGCIGQFSLLNYCVNILNGAVNTRYDCSPTTWTELLLSNSSNATLSVA